MAKGNKTKGNNQRLHKQVKRIQFVALISFVLALVATFLMHMTVESLLSHTEGNSLAGALMLLLLFGNKSLSIVIPLPSHYLAGGMLYSPLKVLAISHMGLAITLSIPYFLERWAGGAGIDYILTRYPKMEKVIVMQKKNEFFSNFIVRIIGWFPYDILSFNSVPVTRPTPFT